ncbi:hypothetical protein [Streptomyces mexicanus]|uniref:Uncharacterized protein n=1 Tax=Streptomyces mexicanus TaxID=178566 RepID=A0A7X1I6S9_9ACTN|nr:hypothetical protein [Streptomyces mexicanus]MBC2869791.1 hypothetical protein [Streptomyces mexicanus]
MKRGIDPLGPTMTALLAAGQLAAWTLLGVTVHNSLAVTETTTAAAPDTPLDQTDPPPAPSIA